MKKTLLASLILAGSLGAASAQAHEALVGAAVGGGVGGLIGHSVGGRDGAVVGGIVGGIVGALAGVALASDSGPRYVSSGYGRPVHYHSHHAPMYRGGHPAHVRPVMMEHGHHRHGHRHADRGHRHDDYRHWR